MPPTKNAFKNHRQGHTISTFFQLLNMERRTDQQTYLLIEMQFYISVMFLGLSDNIQEEKPSFFNFENNWLPTDGRTDGRTDRPSYRDARTHLKTAHYVCTRITLNELS